VQSPLELTFGLTRPQCNMTPGAPCPDAVYELELYLNTLELGI
jgi:hypothetical protein